MPLSAGDKIASYQILAPLGAGGMGEVYRAKDTKLDREVAIKVLPDALAEDHDRLLRFEREAKVLASLNHPNIAQIYGVEERALVMELVQGETLKGPLPLDLILNYARQIAAALEAAHEKGIVHRDLKPANIMVTPDGVIKVLDFGLAAISQGSTRSGADPANSPTLTMQATQAGVIMGTAAYMSPEQARGKPLDKRTDIWSFGVVLYELATGERPFEGPTITDSLAAILKEQPDLTKVPDKLRPLLAKCLDKDPRNRLRDIGDAALLLSVPETTAPVAPQSSRGPQAIAIAAFCAALVLAVLYFARKPPLAPEPMRFSVHLPDNVNFTNSGGITISPDGRHLAFSAVATGKSPAVWIQDLNAESARELPDTETSSVAPPFFWSPDSHFVVFAGARKIRKADIEKGITVDICDKAVPPVGGSWNRDGVIIFGSTITGLWRVPASGGTAVPLTTLDDTRQEKHHQLPQFLPDGKHFLYLATSVAPANSGIFASNLDEPHRANPRVLATGFGVQYVASPQGTIGHLLFFDNGRLLTQAFDASRLELQGQPSLVTGDVGSVYQTGYFSATPDVLAIRHRDSSRVSRLTWLDSQGKPASETSEAGAIINLALSPDNTKLAYEKFSTDLAQTDLWILDLTRDTASRLTFGPDLARYPIWSGDGKELAYAQIHDRHVAIYHKPSNGAREGELLLQVAGNARPTDWSRDGRFLLFAVADNNNFEREETWVLPLFGDRKPFPFAADERLDQRDATFSPDGRFIAYSSNETQRYEVYVRSFTGAPNAAGGKWLVSRDGGESPAWRADGRAIAYLSGVPPKMMMVSIDSQPEFRAGNPVEQFVLQSQNPHALVLTSDFKRSIAALPLIQKVPQSFTILLNWAKPR